MHKSVEDEDVILVLDAILKTRDVSILEHFIGGMINRVGGDQRKKPETRRSTKY